jgi:nitrogen fixation-related uncharacterized protein
VSDPQKPEDRAPRPGAGDAARTQQIPRLGRDGKPVEPKSGDSKRTVADALREARQSPETSKSRPANGSGSRRPAGPARPATGTAPRDKAAPGAPRPEPATDDVSGTDESAAGAARSTPSSRGSQRKPAAKKTAPASTGSSTTRPGARTQPAKESTPTAAEYARTTRQSADATAVIPAVKDDAPPATAPTTSSAPAAAAAPSGSGRQARLRLTHVEPWSVTRLAFVVSVALMIVSVVAVTIFWVVLDLTGIWDQLNGTITNVLSDSEGSFDLTDYLGLGRLVGLTLVFSAINVVLMTAIATIAAHLYNLAAQLLGGIEVTFSDD